SSAAPTPPTTLPLHEPLPIFADVPEVRPVVPDPAVPVSEPAPPPPVAPPDSAAVSPCAPAFAPELVAASGPRAQARTPARRERRSEEHTSELQSRSELVCRLL